MFSRRYVHYYMFNMIKSSSTQSCITRLGGKVIPCLILIQYGIASYQNFVFFFSCVIHLALNITLQVVTITRSTLFYVIQFFALERALALFLFHSKSEQQTFFLLHNSPVKMRNKELNFKDLLKEILHVDLREQKYNSIQ